MRIILSILIFYKKLVIPSLIVALAISLPEWLREEAFPMITVVISYILMSLFFHYFIYEKRNPGEYYFYFNLGLSKIILWGTSLFLSTMIGLILVIVWAICM
jgi:hypothetical protein